MKHPFEFLNLKLDTLKQFNDTTELTFYFYYKDSLKCDLTLDKNRRITLGAAFRYDSLQQIYFISPTTLGAFSEVGKNSRYTIPEQPQAIEYIRENSNKLDYWFKEEAMRRGILKQ